MLEGARNKLSRGFWTAAVGSLSCQILVTAGDRRKMHDSTPDVAETSLVFKSMRSLQLEAKRVCRFE